VTLIHAGWVALGRSQEQQFVLTPAGQRALKKDQIPEQRVVIRRQTNVLLERIAGVVIPEGEVRYVLKKTLKQKNLWESCIKLRGEVLDNRLDEGQVQHLLHRQQGQRLHWVGPIDMISKGENYIPVSVDTDSESIVNLPQRCEARLRPYVVEAAKDAMSKQGESNILTWEGLTQQIKVGQARVSAAAETTSMSNRNWPIHWSPQDLLSTSSQHTELLHQILEKAQTLALITSNTVDVKRLEHLRPAIINALKRDVDVDLLWGNSYGKESLEWMKKFVYEAKRSELGGKLRFNHAPSFCNAKIVLWDEENNGFKGAVGSYEWLADGSGDNSNQPKIQLTIRISHPGIISALAWWVAGVWSGVRSESLSSVPDRWRRIATCIEQCLSGVYDENAAKQVEQATIRVILDRENPTLIRELAAAAQAQLIITSTMLDTIAEKRLSEIFKDKHTDDFIYQVLYGQSELNEQEFQPIHDIITRSTGKLQSNSRLATNAIISDLTTCISSFRFLSHQFPQETNAREVGILIEGAEPCKQIESMILTANETNTVLYVES